MMSGFKSLLAALVLAAPARAVWTPQPLGDDDGPVQGGVANDTLACLILSEGDCVARASAAKMLTSDARDVPQSPPVFGLPGTFERLFAAYPNGSSDTVKALIGRRSEAWIENTCAIRVSYALNFSGIDDLKIDAAFAAMSKEIHFITDKSKPAKNVVYIYRVDEFANYLLKKYGRPQIWAKKGHDNLRQKVYGKKGIILFVVNSWDNATGHFDLWNKDKPAHEDYFDQASDVFLWQ
jgi:hypothetical protein